MSTSRHFLVAHSLARLVQNERGGRQVIEGYFPEQDGRTSYVLLGENGCFLILMTNGPAGLQEERVEVPQAHAEALLDVTAGEVAYIDIKLPLGSREAHIKRFTSPGPLDVLTVEFEREEDAQSFSPLPWFGPEVTGNRSYHHQMVAFRGAEALEVPLSNAALHSLLDTLEGRFPAMSGRASSAANTRSSAPRVRPEQSILADFPTESRAALEMSSANEDEYLLRELARRLRPHQRPN